MNRILFVLLFISSKATAQSNKNSYGIIFQQLGWSEIKKKAQEENKYIFMDLYTTWCAPCKKMDRDVYADSTLGSLINSRFISVKVQMDSSSKDDEFVRKWYADAVKIKNEYIISGYPSFLFFSPNGKLIYQDFGYKSVAKFSKLAEQVVSSKTFLLRTELNEYKNGKRNYQLLPELAIYSKSIGDNVLSKQIAQEYIVSLDETQLLKKKNILLILDIIGDKNMAKDLAMKYKERYLDSLSEEEVLEKDNLFFIAKFRTLVSSHDIIFQTCYSKPDEVDKVIEQVGFSNYLVEQTITREELDHRVIDEKTTWEKLKSVIHGKYDKVDANRLILEKQIRFYRNERLNWNLWAKYKDEYIAKYPPPSEGLSIYIELNVFGAWDVFLHCNEKDALKISIKWIDMALNKDKSHEAAYLDTKANLLYKLGNFRKAIQLEKKAILADKLDAKKIGKDKGENADSFTRALKNMKNRKPTYLEEGAIWKSTLLSDPN